MLSSLLTQNLIVAAILLTAIALLLLRASKYFRPAKGNGNCASGCGGCASKSSQAKPGTGQPRLLQLGERHD